MSRIGPYEIVEEIGRGGMRMVFRRVDPVIGRLVAVKTIRLDDVIDLFIDPVDLVLEHGHSAQDKIPVLRAIGVARFVNVEQVHMFGSAEQKK